MDDAARYLQGYSATEQARLREQPVQLEADARWLLDRVGIRPGWRTIDLGCGPQGVLDLLAEKVGNNGSVVGLDRSGEFVRLARQFATDRGLANVEVIQGDATATGLPRGSFDLVHERLVLTNIPDPVAAVAEMAALARPGGFVALHDVFANGFIEPPLPAWSRIETLYLDYCRGHGIDPHPGRSIPGVLRASGLVDIGLRPVMSVYPPGHPRRMIYPQLIENFRMGLVASGAVTDPELDNLLSDVRARLADPDTLVVSTLFLQVWARKPL